MAIDHIDIVVTDFDRSLAFYRGLLGPLGYTREGPIAGERGEHVLYLGHEAGAATARSACAASSPRPTRCHDRYASASTTSRIAAPSREVVDERAQWLLAEGATIESGPAEYDYSPGYYAVFFYDPDGIKLEIVHRTG